MQLSKKLKVALVHDILVEKGGAEKIIYEFSRIFPQADIYTFCYKKSIFKNYFFNKHKIFAWTTTNINFWQTKSIGKLLAYWYWYSLDLRAYDLVISSSNVFSAKGVHTSPQTLHVSYCHGWPKYLYEEASRYQQLSKMALLSLLLGWLLRYLDQQSAKKPDILLANSKYVSHRLQHLYIRKAQVIYPPIKMPPGLKVITKKNNYFCYVGRISWEKNLELLIDTFNVNGRKLVIAGTGEYLKMLKKKANSNIAFLGWVGEKKKWQLLQRAKGFILPSLNEDFGISVAEALAAGCPVITYYKGGHSEMIKSGLTGEVFKKNDQKSLNKTIDVFQKKKYDIAFCQKIVKKLDTKNFDFFFKEAIYD